VPTRVFLSSLDAIALRPVRVFVCVCSSVCACPVLRLLITSPQVYDIGPAAAAAAAAAGAAARHGASRSGPADTAAAAPSDAAVAPAAAAAADRGCHGNSDSGGGSGGERGHVLQAGQGQATASSAAAAVSAARACRNRGVWADVGGVSQEELERLERR
jgi:hypothetical protein